MELVLLKRVANQRLLSTPGVRMHCPENAWDGGLEKDRENENLRKPPIKRELLKV